MKKKLTIIKMKIYPIKNIRNVKVSDWNKFIRGAKKLSKERKGRVTLSNYFGELLCGHHNKSL